MLEIGARIVGVYTVYQNWFNDPLDLFALNMFNPHIWIEVLLYRGLFLALNGVLLHRNGQTIGKRLLKIAMVDADTYERVPLARLYALRYLIWSIPYLINSVLDVIIFIVDLSFGLRKDRRTLHDMTANTVVVKVNRLTTSKRYL